jgi:hypothetical protein
MKMNKTNMPEPDLDNFLQQTLKDDLPPDAEARMHRYFLRHRRSLDRIEQPADQRANWLGARGAFRKEVLAFVSVVMLILGAVLHFRTDPSALADSIKKCMQESSQTVGQQQCLVEAQFLRNRPIPQEFFIPGSNSANQRGNR